MHIARTSIAALSVLALSASLAWATDYLPDQSGIDDTTGVTAIGVDISGIPATQGSVQQFLAGLAPDTQRGVIGGCQTVVSFPAGVAPNVVEFCQTAVGGAPASSMLMGYAPEARLTGTPLLTGQPVGAY